MAVSNYKITDAYIGVSPVSATYSSPAAAGVPLGYIARGADLGSGASAANMGAGEFIFVQGSNCSSVGRWVQVAGNSAVLAGTVNSVAPAPLGIACAVLSATNIYGWAQIAGNCDFVLGTNSSIATNALLYIANGTAGVAVTNVVIGNRIINAQAGGFGSYTSSASLSQTVWLNRPYQNGITASN